MKMLSLIRKFKNVSLVFSASDSLILRKIEKSVDFSKGNIVTIICNDLKTKSAQANPSVTSEVKQTSSQLHPPSCQSLSVFKPLKMNFSGPCAFEKTPLMARFKQLTIKVQPFSVHCKRSGNHFPFALDYPFGGKSKISVDQTLPVFGHSTLLVSQSCPFSSSTTCTDDPDNLKPDPVTGLTPKMVNLLKCLAVAIKPDLHLHAVKVFQRTFQMDRSVQRMFPKFPCDDICALEDNPDFNKHVDNIMKALVYTMEVSGSVPDLKSNLAVQKKIHKDLCIPDKHFITLGNAINDYLKDTLGVRYSEDVECAVAFWWKYLAMEMTAKPGQTKCPQCGATIIKVEGKRTK